MYQSVALIFGYAYGIFTARDLFKVGAVLTVVEGFLIMILVPVYWPLIGLSWTTAPAGKRTVPMHAEAAVGVQSVDRVLEESQEKGHISSLALMQPTYLLRVPTSLPPVSLGSDPETDIWALLKDSTNSLDVTDFLTAYPASRFTVAAGIRSRQNHTPLPPIAPDEPWPPRQAEAQQEVQPHSHLTRDLAPDTLRANRLARGGLCAGTC